MPIDVQPLPPPVYQPAPRGGLTIVPPAGSAARPPAAPTSGGGATMTVTASGARIEDARRAALAEARRVAGLRGIGGAARVRAESFLDGAYTGLIEFDPDAAPAGPASGGTIDPPVPIGPDGAPLPPPPRATLGKPNWILVIPVQVAANGRAAWSRETDWGRSWQVPARQAGMRIVATMGDADDHDRLPPAALADSSGTGLESGARAVARKYGAPAVAVVRLDERSGTVATWLWRSGGFGHTAERPVAVGGDSAAARAATLDALTELAKASGDEEPVPGDGAPPRERDAVRAYLSVEGTAADGALEVSVSIDATDSERQTALRRRVRDLPGLTVRSLHGDAVSLEVSGLWSGSEAALVQALEASGIAVRR